jgi:hypothetical protein
MSPTRTIASTRAHGCGRWKMTEPPTGLSCEMSVVLSRSRVCDLAEGVELGTVTHAAATD